MIISSWRWQYFTPAEVLSPAGLARYVKYGHLLVQPFALDTLSEFREKLGLPLLCNHGSLTLRGYRTPQENESCGGATLSAHCQGIAFDISCKHISVTELYKAAVAHNFGGVGVYPTMRFVHVDCRAVERQKIWSY